jgi:hypothetical protein
MAQDKRRGFEIVDDFPFMLRHSKHSEPFFSSLLGAGFKPAPYEFGFLFASLAVNNLVRRDLRQSRNRYSPEKFVCSLSGSG